MKRILNIIVAIDKKNGIGKDGCLPWNIPGDMKHFKDITMKVSQEGKMNAVIMGRKTWNSIPEAFRPLKDRVNVVLTRNRDLKFDEGVIVARDFDDAIKRIDEQCSDKVESVFAIGGQQVFIEALSNPLCENLFVTQIENIFDCDTFFPEFNDKFTLKSQSEVMNEKGNAYCFSEYQRSFREC